jgi:hypothetical protein
LGEARDLDAPVIMAIRSGSDGNMIIEGYCSRGASEPDIRASAVRTAGRLYESEGCVIRAASSKHRSGRNVGS